MIRFQIYQAQQKDRRESEWFLLIPQLAPIQRETSRCTRKSYDSISVPQYHAVLWSAGAHGSWCWGNQLKAKGTWRFLETWSKYLFMCVGNKLVIHQNLFTQALSCILHPDPDKQSGHVKPVQPAMLYSFYSHLYSYFF